MGGFVRNITGKTAAKSQERASRLQVEAGERAREELREDLAPFREAGLPAVERLQELNTQEGAQNFLDNNQLFQASRDNAITAIKRRAVGDGQEGSAQIDLANALGGLQLNFLNNERNNLLNQARLGQSSAAQTADASANITQGIGNAQAAGVIGAANSRTQGSQNLLDLGGAALSSFLFSDERLKENMNKIGETDEGLPIYVGNMKGSNKSQLFIKAQEAMKKFPNAVRQDPSGFLKVDHRQIA